jgi:hypothetical protein
VESVQIRKECYPKIRCYVKDAKIDGELSSLGNSIKNFESAAKVLLQLLNLWLQKKYSEELTMAAAQMESLNSL